MSRKLESIDIEVNERKGTSAPTWEVVSTIKTAIIDRGAKPNLYRPI